ncbi:MAG: hypothetical protein ACOYN3_00890 [Acidimicrobiia bacterium]
MLPETVHVGTLTFTVARLEASPELHGETQFRHSRILVHPSLKGEMAVGIFVHELCHAIAYCAGQHRSDTRGEEYVTNLGHIVHGLAKGNPALVDYMTGIGPIPAEITVFPFPIRVRSVAASELAPDDFSELDEENLLIRVADDVAPEVGCWEITTQALTFAFRRTKAAATADRQVELLTPVAGLLIDTIRRNPEVAAILSEPIRRETVLRAVSEENDLAV